jgi:hypothetical protein
MRASVLMLLTIVLAPVAPVHGRDTQGTALPSPPRESSLTLRRQAEARARNEALRSREAGALDARTSADLRLDAARHAARRFRLERGTRSPALEQEVMQAESAVRRLEAERRRP